MALIPDTMTTNTPTHCSPSSILGMPPTGFQTFTLNGFQCPEQHEQSGMLYADTLPAQTIPNSTAPTTWIDTYPTAPSYSFCGPATAVSQATTYDSTAPCQGTMQPFMPLAQVQDDVNILGSSTSAHRPVQMGRQCSRSTWSRCV